MYSVSRLLAKRPSLRTQNKYFLVAPSQKKKLEASKCTSSLDKRLRLILFLRIITRTLL
jgi:hypothetical protein